MAARPAPLSVSAADRLPAAALVEACRREAWMACAARCLDLPWPPGAEAEAMMAAAPLVALAALEAFCEGVSLPALARTLRVGMASAPRDLAALRASGRWPAEAFKAAVAGVQAQLATGGGATPSVGGADISPASGRELMPSLRNLGLDERSACAGGAGRRKIEPADIAYANDKRGLGWSWQTIAKIRSVNQHDLMAKCGALGAGDAPALPKPVARPEPVKVNGKLRVLLEVARGANLPAMIAERLGFSGTTVSVYLSNLRRDELCAGYVHSSEIKITDAGRRLLRKAGLKP